MKKQENTIKYQVFEVLESDGNMLGIFDTLEEASKLFLAKIAEGGEKLIDYDRWVIEINKVEVEECDDIEELEILETLSSQIMYEQGIKDRKNYKGDNALNYYYEAFYNSEKKELEYTFYFQGAMEDEGILESELKNWYY